MRGLPMPGRLASHDGGCRRPSWRRSEGRSGMIHGLKSAFTGEEIIGALNGLIESKRAKIQFKRDEIAGTVQSAQDGWQVPAEQVEDEIDDIEHSIRTLTLIRDRLLPGETYLLGRRELRQAGLM